MTSKYCLVFFFFELHYSRSINVMSIFGTVLTSKTPIIEITYSLAIQRMFLPQVSSICITRELARDAEQTQLSLNPSLHFNKLPRGLSYRLRSAYPQPVPTSTHPLLYSPPTAKASNFYQKVQIVKKNIVDLAWVMWLTTFPLQMSKSTLSIIYLG